MFLSGIIKNITRFIKHVMFSNGDNNCGVFHKRQLAEYTKLGYYQKNEIEAVDIELHSGDSVIVNNKLKMTETLDKHEVDAFYMAFEDRFRGTREEIAKRLEVYLPFVRKASAGGMILDLGCGRGEWLELLKNHNYYAKGIDTNRFALIRCREMGMDVSDSDAVEYLISLSSESCDVVTGFHLVEHLPFATLLKLVKEVFRVLKPNGVAIFETPDPENICVGTRNFNLDPTHRNPIPDETLAFIAEYFGFVRTEILKTNKISDPVMTENTGLNEIIRRFYMTQDYALIAWKR